MGPILLKIGPLEVVSHRVENLRDGHGGKTKKRPHNLVFALSKASQYGGFVSRDGRPAKGPLLRLA